MINRIHGGNCPEPNIIDFSVNINPLGPPKGLSDIIAKNAGLILHYPDPFSERLKRRLSAFHDIGSENIAIGNGSIELIYLVSRIFKIKKALIVTPTFSEYEYALRLNGSMPGFFNTHEQEHFVIDRAKITRSIPRAGILFLCNPNNPTGSLLHGDEMLHLVRLCKKRGTTLILDEAFIDFTEEARKKAVMSESVKNESLVILRSMTKFFAMPGLRLGYAIGHKRIMERIAEFQYPWNVNGLAQLVGERVLANKDYMHRTRAFIAKERQYMLEGLNNIKGLKVYPPSANFILCRLRAASVRNSKELIGRLLQDGIYIRDCGNFRGLDDTFFRIAVRKRSDNIRLITAFKKVL